MFEIIISKKDGRKSKIAFAQEFFCHLNIFIIETSPSKEIKILPSVLSCCVSTPSARSFAAGTIH